MKSYSEKNSYCMYVMSLFVVFSFYFVPNKAEAYIDPNTGGIFFTSVLPFVYGILAAIVIFWKRIVNMVKGFFSKKNKDKIDS